METKKSLENEELPKEKELLSDKELSEVAGGRPYRRDCMGNCISLKGEEWEKCYAECRRNH